MSENGTATPARRTIRWVGLIITTLLTLLFLYLAFRKVNWEEIFTSFQKARYGLLLLSLLISSGALVLRAIRWKILLDAGKPIALPTVFWANNVGYLGNNFLPARAGEIIRSAVVAKDGNSSLSFTLATAVTERIIDAVLLVLISIWLIFSIKSLPQSIIVATRTMAILASIALIGILFAPRLERWFLLILNRLPLPSRIKEKVAEFLQRFIVGLGVLRNPARFLPYFGLSCGILICDAIATTIIGSAFHLSVNLSTAFILLAALGVSSVIPSAPGYVGLYQLVAVAVLVPLGFQKEEALVFILAFQVLGYVFVGFWGGIGLLKMPWVRGFMKSRY